MFVKDYNITIIQEVPEFWITIDCTATDRSSTYVRPLSRITFCWWSGNVTSLDVSFDSGLLDSESVLRSAEKQQKPKRSSETKQHLTKTVRRQVKVNNNNNNSAYTTSVLRRHSPGAQAVVRAFFKTAILSFGVRSSTLVDLKFNADCRSNFKLSGRQL